jgi:hypothetical protein
MELPPSAFTSWLSALTLQFIDRPFDDRPIGKQRFYQSLDLAGQTEKSLAKLTEFLTVCFSLYAHKYITYRFQTKSQGKNALPQTFLLGELKKNPVGGRIAAYGGLTADHLSPPPTESLLSESQLEISWPFVNRTWKV